MPYDSAIPTLVDGLRIRVVFFGPDVPKLEAETFGGNVEQWARSKIIELNTPRAKTTITVGVPLDLTPPADPVPTAEQRYNAARVVTLQHAQDIAAGIYDASDPTTQADLAKAQASYAALTEK